VTDARARYDERDRVLTITQPSGAQLVVRNVSIDQVERLVRKYVKAQTTRGPAVMEFHR
jgi:hypothetical protein